MHFFTYSRACECIESPSRNSKSDKRQADCMLYKMRSNVSCSAPSTLQQIMATLRRRWVIFLIDRSTVDFFQEQSLLRTKPILRQKLRRLLVFLHNNYTGYYCLCCSIVRSNATLFSWGNRELKQTTTATWTRTLPNNKFSEQNNSSRRAFWILEHFLAWPFSAKQQHENNQTLRILENANADGFNARISIWGIWTLSLHIQLGLLPEPIDTPNISGNISRVNYKFIFSLGVCPWRSRRHC